MSCWCTVSRTQGDTFRTRELTTSDPKVPMIPAALIGILAVNRLGAIHAVVFGGFAAGALAQRIEASRPAAILTASCGIDGNKPPTAYRGFVEEAVALSAWKPPRTVVWQREQLAWHPVRKTEGERSWQNLVRSARARGVRADCVPVGSAEGIYIIYTSGTTGLPKGVVRDTGGHAVGLHMSISYLFGIHGPGDVMGCFSDIGWVVGHSYTLYGPLLTGAATVLYEGKPVGTPDPSAFWRLVEEYKINTMFTAPTALRAIRKEDPDNKAISAIGRRGGLRSLKALFLAGERSEPAIITMYQDLLKKYGSQEGAGARVIDNWWSSESGSPISGIALAPHAGKDRKVGRKEHPPLQIKPGSAGKPMPGFDVRVVDDQGNELSRGKMGNIVLAAPLAPTAFRTLWQDEERFYNGYLKRFGGRWIDTGDTGIVDEQGYIHIMARSGKLFRECLFFDLLCFADPGRLDDVINVAAHRLSTGKSRTSPLPVPILTLRPHTCYSYRKPGTSHNVASARNRGVRSRHPGRVEGTDAFRLCRHEQRRLRLRRAAAGGTAEAGPEAGRPHRLAGWHDPREGHDTQDAVGQDAAAGLEAVAGERRAWRVRQGCRYSVDG